MNHTTASCGHDVIAVGAPGSIAHERCEKLPCAKCKGMETPWGQAQGVKAIGKGIIFVSTASHGGYFVPHAYLDLIAPSWRAYAKRWSGSENWYEEDCCWAGVALAFPDLFPADALVAAENVSKYVASRV